MPSPEPFRQFTRRLEEMRIPYAVTGSVAASFYGEPRLTNDIDLIVLLRPEDAVRIEKGFPIDDFYCPPAEVISMELAREQRGHFNLIHHETGFKADVYLAGGDPFHAWALEHVQAVDMEGETIRIAPPEYVIVRKLQFYHEGGSPKHLSDIRRMLAGLGETWSRETLLDWISRYGLELEWEKARGSGSNPLEKGSNHEDVIP